MKAIKSATFKNTPADFVVTEILPFADDLTGKGEHLWLYLEKTGLNTAHLATLLAKWANIAPKNVGFSGIKDRHAITRQWFSLYVSNNAPDLATFDGFFAEQLADNEHLVLLKHSFHQKKLNRGTHKANHFKITLKDVVFDNQDACQTALETLKTQGFPNFFGNQRFGHNGANLDKAHALFAKAKKLGNKFKPKAKDSLIISSARSHLFNEILAQRVADGTWRTGVDGDVFNLDGTGSLFESPLDETLIARLDSGDVHPTAPLYGKGGKQASKHALDLEQKILNRPDLRPLVDGLDNLTTGQRRALRAIPKELHYAFDGDVLTLEFTLPTGSFATSLLDGLVETLLDKAGFESDE